jgi:ABC-type nitrate/sulfonate/bicarbonate transport system substrate-binding protein
MSCASDARQRLALLTLLAAVVGCWFGGCSRESAQARQDTGAGLETDELRYQSLAGHVLYPELAEDLGYLAPLQLRSIGSTYSGPQDLQSTATNDTDFSLAFNGIIAKMVAAKVPIRSVIGVYNVDAHIWNGLYVLDTSTIKGPRDFIGRKVAMNTLGAHSEFVLREYLTRGGLSEAEISQVTLLPLPPANSEQALRSGTVDAVHFLWAQRDVALERGGIHAVVNDYTLFGHFNAASYVMSQRFLREKPKAARKFVEAIARTIEWGRTTPHADIQARLASIVAKRKRNEDSSLLKYWKPAAQHTPGGVLLDRDFGLWIDWLVKAGQLKPNQLKPGDVYTNQWNPYAK